MTVTIDAIAATTVTVSGKDLAPVAIPATSEGLKVGDKVTLGIRPHALSIPSTGSIVGKINLVERLGNETIVNLNLASETTWLAVLDGDHNLSIGQTLPLAFDAQNAIIFDSEGLARHPK